MKKKILILANSIKGKGHRCVAGIEILNEDLENPNFGKWIRPIDASQKEGALLDSTTEINGTQLHPLQIVEIEISNHASDPNHPEDWNIDRTLPWKLLRTFDSSILPSLPTNAADAWNNENRISPGSSSVTLQIIKFSDPFTVKGEYETWSGESSFKRKAYFPSLRCGMTDPSFSYKHYLYPSQIAQGEEKTITVKANTYVVFSLTPPHGLPQMQYRVVAAIIEP